MGILANEITSDYLAAIGSCAAVILSLITFIISTVITSRRENKMTLMKKFNEIYYKTFSLRNKITNQFSETLSGEEFYFEIDYILNCSDMKIKILDYLNEMENLFVIVKGKYFLYKPFKKLMSYALYARLVVFYGLIIKMREIEGNDRMLLNYTSVINKVENMKKIKTQAKMDSTKYYIGIRNSDATYASGYFCKNITMFTDKNALQFSVRPNQNKDVSEFLPFVIKQVEKISKKNSKIECKNEHNCKFMFYNGSMAYRLPQSLHKYFICLNDQEILSFLNDKISCKGWLINNKIPVVQYETVSGNEIKSASTKNFFRKIKKFVLQDNHGGGGIGTFLLTCENFSTIQEQLIPLKHYILSPYLENSISVNTHIFVSDKQTVLSPASVQLIETRNNQLCYRGADFFAFKTVAPGVKDTIKKLSLKIADRLRNLGYRGIAGIDFIISENREVYCAEINPRFQASSILLDSYLSEKSKRKNKLARSVFELNEQAFNNILKTDLCFQDEINLSCYYYYKDAIPEEYFKRKAELLTHEKADVHLDGLNFDGTEQFNDDSYMFRAVFAHPISTISPDHELWINDNVTIAPKPTNILDLKIALLNQGIRLINSDCKIKKGVYESIDIVFCGKDFVAKPTDINCAFGVNLSRYSPFELDCLNNKLFYYDELLGSAYAELDLLSGLPEVDKKILYLATDRLRIKLIGGCEFKNFGKGCAFCNVPVSEKRFELSEIYEALEKLKKLNPTFRHILIGGGTCLDVGIWDKIMRLAEYLKNDEYYRNKPISLMTVLPPKDKLQALKDAGITEVAFNLEIADDSLAKKYMKGKRSNKEYYYEVMKEAVKIFGTKNVRSALIVGLDRSEDIVNEVKTMAHNGILPCLSAYRSLPGAELSLFIPPVNSYLRDIYEKCESAVKKSGNSVCELGPLCKRCQNNMLIV